MSLQAPHILIVLLVLGLVGCGSSPKRGAGMDGPPMEGGTPNLEDAVVRAEPPSRYGNPPSYVVFGKRYYTMKSALGYRERGIASWYGTKFHGRRTSSGERYDMYRMTAAHKSLPLPTYVEVRNLQNGRTAILRVNDRGPFHEGRIIDLSYAAALKLDILRTGTGLVEVRALSPGERRGPLPAPDTREPLPGPAPLQVRDSAPAEGMPTSTNAPLRVATQSDDEAASRATISTQDRVGATVAPVVSPIDSEPAGFAPSRVASADSRIWVQIGAFRDVANARELAQRVASTLGVTPQVQEHVGADGVVMRRVRIGPLASVDAVDALLAQLRTGVGMPQGRVVIEP